VHKLRVVPEIAAQKRHLLFETEYSSMRELAANEIDFVNGAGFGEFVEGAVTAVGGISAIGAGMSAGGAAAAATGATAAALALGGVLLVAGGAGLVMYGVYQMAQ